MRRKVDLPEPFGPMSPTRSPSERPKERPSNSGRAPKPLVRDSQVRRTAGGIGVALYASPMPLKRILVVSVLSLLTMGATSERELDHLAAYARLLSLVRFFHPSDAVANADWNQVAVAGVKAIEGAENPESLARSLESFFRLLAPTLRVLPNGARWEMPEELRHRPAGIVAWRHHGGGFGANKKIYSSERISDLNPSGFGTVAQAIPAGPLRGKR